MLVVSFFSLACLSLCVCVFAWVDVLLLLCLRAPKATPKASLRAFCEGGCVVFACWCGSGGQG